MPSQMIILRRHSIFRISVRPCMHDQVCWPRYLTDCLWEFHEVYNLGAVGNKD